MSGVITFGDGAEEALSNVASFIPPGYIVALLKDGEEPPADDTKPHPGIDFELLSVDQTDGVLVRNAENGIPTGEPFLRPWDSFDRIHVY